jgi:hypothetical protein
LLARIQVGGDLGLLARRLAVNIVGCHLKMKGQIQSVHILCSSACFWHLKVPVACWFWQKKKIGKTSSLSEK